jgi:hypothetical protein
MRQVQNQEPLLYAFDLDSHKSIDLTINVLSFYAPYPPSSCGPFFILP